MKIVCMVESRVPLVYRSESFTPFILSEACAEPQTILYRCICALGSMAQRTRSVYHFRLHLLFRSSYLMGARVPRGLATMFAFTVPSGLCAALWHIRTQLFAPRL